MKFFILAMIVSTVCFASVDSDCDYYCKTQHEDSIGYMVSEPENECTCMYSENSKDTTPYVDNGETYGKGYTRTKEEIEKHLEDAESKENTDD